MQLYFGTARIIGLKRANAVRLPQMSCIIKSSQYNFLKTIKWVIIFSINFLGIIDGAIVFSPRENRAIHIPSVSGCSFLHHERKKEGGRKLFRENGRKIDEETFPYNTYRRRLRCTVRGISSLRSSFFSSSFLSVGRSSSSTASYARESRVCCI